MTAFIPLKNFAYFRQKPMEKTFTLIKRTGLVFFWLFTIALLGVPRIWAQRANFGPMGLNSDHARTHQQYDSRTVTTVQGQVETPGSYGMVGWRVAPGMQIQGMVLTYRSGPYNDTFGTCRVCQSAGLHHKKRGYLGGYRLQSYPRRPDRAFSCPCQKRRTDPKSTG